ncbi:MAG: leucine-rich repeat protein [Clostridia bacterium]|nr:leucine-rich repeat protein [Clostridia bacterium]
MKKTLKRILATFLTVIMLFSALPLAGIDFVPKANALASTGKCGENVYWNFDSSTGTLTISGTGKMYDFDGEDSPFYKATLVKNITINKGVTSIGKYIFYHCNNLQKIQIPDSITNIEIGAFLNCYNLKSIAIPNSVTGISRGTFFNCYCLTDVIIPQSVTRIEEVAFGCCESLINLTIPDSVTYIGVNAFEQCYGLESVRLPNKLSSIEHGAFFLCKSLKSVILPSSITNIGDFAFSDCPSLEDVYFLGSQSQWNKVNIGDYNGYLLNATIHYGNIYNIGEETYNFPNFIDSDSKIGHCFGMSIVSGGYYIKSLDINQIGISNCQKLYILKESDTVKKPICHYQKIQGKYANDSIVAGENLVSNSKNSTQKVWNECINYVKNHEHDYKGDLQIQIRKNNKSGHCLNFLYYERVGDQDRIYAYDNNFPKDEVYFYIGNDNKIYETDKTTFDYVKTIALRDIATYFLLANGYTSSRYIYAPVDTIDIECATAYPMACGDEGMYMYEIPDDVKQISITPLIDNAQFEYMDKTYSFGKITDVTVGNLTLSKNNQSVGASAFVIRNRPDFSLSNIELKYKNTAKIVPQITVDDGVKYTVKYESSDPSIATVDKDGNITTHHKGETKVTCTVTDEYGNVVKGTCTVTVKFSFGQWLIWILLFGFLWY